jgi:hypothetical protein
LNFISNDNFNTMTGDFTNKFQEEIKININNAHLIIHKVEKLEYVNLHPNPPTITGLIRNLYNKHPNQTYSQLD